jgi:hypothetical protein
MKINAISLKISDEKPHLKSLNTQNIKNTLQTNSHEKYKEKIFQPTLTLLPIQFKNTSPP